MLAQALASVLDKTWDAKAISSHESRSWEAVAAEMFEIFETLVTTRQKARV